jgi:hypothetical protein
VRGQINETKFADIIDDQGSSFLGPIRADKKNGELKRKNKRSAGLNDKAFMEFTERPLHYAHSCGSTAVIQQFNRSCSPNSCARSRPFLNRMPNMTWSSAHSRKLVLRTISPTDGRR